MENLKRISALVALLIIISAAGNRIIAQDTLRIMQYNLLYYGKYIYECDQYNNNPDDKNTYLKKIFDYLQPDIIAVNELDGESANPIADDHLYLLNNALNVDGKDEYRAAPFAEDFLANTIFYNRNKLTLHQYDSIEINVSGPSKIFNKYTFYHNSSDLETTNDTIFLTFFVIHLKAGRGSDDAQVRYNEVLELTSFMEGISMNNVFIVGDLNVYNADEEAFQEIVNPTDDTYKFYDPLNQLGDWHSNESFKMVHTQSTHSSSTCHSGGGMDDRFDFILPTRDVFEGTNGVNYIDQSYRAVGQDGSYFNQYMNMTSNEDVPNDIAEALYYMSDHLPVTMDVKINSDYQSYLEILSMEHTPSEPVPDMEVTVWAELIDTEDTVEVVRLKWGTESGIYSDSVTMTFESGKYKGKIPGKSDGVEIFYTVNGYNTSDDIVVSTDEKSYTVNAPVGIDANLFEEPEILVENPFGQDIHINVKSSEFCQKYRVKLYNISGMLLYATIFSSSGCVIPAEKIQPGIYILHISCDGFVITKKIVKYE